MDNIKFNGNVLIIAKIGGASLLACDGEEYDRTQLVEMLGEQKEVLAIPLPDGEQMDLMTLINTVLDDVYDGNLEKYPERYIISM